MNYAGLRKGIGVAVGVGWMTLCQGALAQSLGEECPLEQRGRACTDQSTCVEFTCSETTDGGASIDTKRAFCQSGSFCSPDQKYMDRCGTNGRCVAEVTEFGEPGKRWCRSGDYVCSEFPASIDLDASPDVQRGQLCNLCPDCCRPGNPANAVDAGAIPSKNGRTTNAATPSSSGNGSSGCAVAPARRSGRSDPNHSSLLSAIAAAWAIRRRRSVQRNSSATSVLNWASGANGERISQGNSR
jgi:hypothetical protein